MKELFDLLAKRERKILVLLCVCLLVGLLFYQVFALKQKRAYSFAVESLPAQQIEYTQIKESNKDIKLEWLQWDETKRDIAEIEKKYFYRENKNINQLRIDLRKIFRATKIRVVSDLMFDYTAWEEENLKRVRVKFTMAGPYNALKRFIHQIEIHPKFLMIERIDFRDIDTQSGRIELNIALMGYYEN
jgi:Tfp pilus assembly protein PilO